MVQRAIQTLKSMLIKTLISKGDLNLTVIDYNNTPKDHLNAPAQMLMGRLLKTVLPVPKKVVEPLFPTRDTLQTLKQKQARQKTYYDKNAHPLRPLKDNEEVFFQKGIRDWVPGKILQKHDMPNSYIVKTEDGTYRRNRIHLKPANYEQKNTPQKLQSSETQMSQCNRPRRNIKR